MRDNVDATGVPLVIHREPRTLKHARGPVFKPKLAVCCLHRRLLKKCAALDGKWA